MKRWSWLLAGCVCAGVCHCCGELLLEGFAWVVVTICRWWRTRDVLCRTVLCALISIGSLTLCWCQNLTGAMSLACFQLMRWSCSCECLMMADFFSRCPSLPCAWCSLIRVDMLRPVSPMKYNIHRECGKHRPCPGCLVCPGMCVWRDAWILFGAVWKVLIWAWLKMHCNLCEAWPMYWMWWLPWTEVFLLVWGLAWAGWSSRSCTRWVAAMSWCGEVTASSCLGHMCRKLANQGVADSRLEASLVCMLVKRETMSKMTGMSDYDWDGCPWWCWWTGLSWWCDVVWGRLVGAGSWWYVWPCCRLVNPWLPWLGGGDIRLVDLGLTEENWAGECSTTFKTSTNLCTSISSPPHPPAHVSSVNPRSTSLMSPSAPSRRPGVQQPTTWPGISPRSSI